LFRRYIASSPSLWWDDAILLKQESEFGKRNAKLERAVFLSVGAREADDMRQHFQPFVDSVRLRKYSGLSIESVVLPDEDHLSVFIPAFVRGLRAVYR
jgi:predicted alpha/beta superfamily hydrolase